jgi:hypothetical protein
MQHNALVKIVFTGLYVWVVSVTSCNLYCTNYFSTGNRYRLDMFKTVAPGFRSCRLYITVYSFMTYDRP